MAEELNWELRHQCADGCIRSSPHYGPCEGVVDMIHHPPHYTEHPSGVECITIVEHMGFCLGNAIKYIWRADLKDDAIEDLKKARWYIDREIERRGVSKGDQPEAGVSGEGDGDVRREPCGICGGGVYKCAGYCE